MEKKMKVLTDVEIMEDITNSELYNKFGRIVYSYEACGAGGCGGGCGRHTSRGRNGNMDK